VVGFFVFVFVFVFFFVLGGFQQTNRNHDEETTPTATRLSASD